LISKQPFYKLAFLAGENHYFHTSLANCHRIQGTHTLTQITHFKLMCMGCEHCSCRAEFLPQSIGGIPMGGMSVAAEVDTL